MKPKVIKTEAEYKATLACIDKIFDAKPGTLKGDELELLLLLVEKYEEAEFPIALPDPVAAVRFRMEQDQLGGRRPLSLTMIRNLMAGLGIPAEVLLQKPAGKLEHASG